MILGTENFKSFSQKYLRKNAPRVNKWQRERESESERRPPPQVCNMSRPVHCIVSRCLHCGDGGTDGDDCFIIVIVLFTLTS